MAYKKKSRVVPPVLGESHEDGGEAVEVTTRFRVSRDQAEAFKALPGELQERLGPPVYGHVLTGAELRSLGRRAAMAETSSTIMCPW